jgi:hypothetical protein
MTDEQLREIEGRANAATPGPWFQRASIDKDMTIEGDIIYVADSYGPNHERDTWDAAVAAARADAAFIAAARDDVPALIAELRELRAWKKAVPVNAILRDMNGWGNPESTEAIEEWVDALRKVSP